MTTTATVIPEGFESRFELSNQRIHAFVSEFGRFERISRQARELLDRFPDPGHRPPLYGTLVGVKDIFHVEGLPTTAGSRLPPELLAGTQAETVSRLTGAGALVAGKTVTTEFAYFAPGGTRNPRALSHTPGGSSSGSAAAVAAGLCPLALGTQTIGSISRPAAFCGVVGFKPTYDRISRAGVIPLAPSLDHVGLFATDLDLLQRAAGVLSDTWQSEPQSDSRPALAIPAGPYLELATDEAREHFFASVEILRSTGYHVVSVPAMTDIEVIQARHATILTAEALAVHSQWIESFESLYDTRTLELFERGRGVSEIDLDRALEGREKLRKELAAAAARESTQVWISPAATGPAPEGLDSTGSPAMNLPWTQAGVPTLALPSSTNEAGLPMGLQLAADWRQDERLLHWGRDIYDILRPLSGIESCAP